MLISAFLSLSFSSLSFSSLPLLSFLIHSLLLSCFVYTFIMPPVSITESSEWLRSLFTYATFNEL